MQLRGWCSVRRAEIAEYMTFIDTLITILAVGGALIGWWRGMVPQVVSIAGYVLGIIAANVMGDWGTELLTVVMPESAHWPFAHVTQSIVAHVIIFLLVMLTVRVAGLFIKDVISALNLGLLNRVGGSAICAFKYLLLLSAMLNLWLVISPKSEIFDGEHMMNNKPFEITMQLAPWCLGVKERLAQDFEQKMNKEADSADNQETTTEEE